MKIQTAAMRLLANDCNACGKLEYLTRLYTPDGDVLYLCGTCWDAFLDRANEDERMSEEWD